MDYKYIWKINTIDGKSFYIKSDENDMAKFTEKLLSIKGETISIFDCAEEELVRGIKAKYNSVVIVGSKVSSVEFYTKR